MSSHSHVFRDSGQAAVAESPRRSTPMPMLQPRRSLVVKRTRTHFEIVHVSACTRPRSKTRSAKAPTLQVRRCIRATWLFLAQNVNPICAWYDLGVTKCVPLKVDRKL